MRGNSILRVVLLTGQSEVEALISLAVGLVLLAAVFHAGWNILLKGQKDPLSMARKASLVSTIMWTPAAVVAWLLAGRPTLPSIAWKLAILSAFLELLYFVFLSSAYRRGTLSAVYSLARGTAPLLAVLAGVLILGEKLTSVEIVGIVALLTGLWSVRRPQPAGSATVPAALTGVTIAAYSAVDSAGVHNTQAWLYGFVVWTLTTTLLVIFEPVARRLDKNNDDSPQMPAATDKLAVADPGLIESAIVGILMTSTYFMILIALRLAPLAIVSPLRESAIVLVTLWGIWKLHEREKLWLKLGGATAIAVGATLVAIG